MSNLKQNISEQAGRLREALPDTEALKQKMSGLYKQGAALIKSPTREGLEDDDDGQPNR